MIFLGVDCGTQTLKVVAWNAEKGELVSASRGYEMIPGLGPGHKEQNPQDWLDALDGCVHDLKGRGVPFSEVRAVGVSGQQHGLVVLDESDRVIRPSKLWCDTSTEAECLSILEVAGGLKAYFEEVGNALPPGFTASKLLWLRRREPGNYRRVRTVFLPHDFLNFHLTGNKVAECGDASGTGYFRVRQRDWSPGVLSWIDPERDLMETLPPLVPSNQAVGEVRTELARRWGLPAGVLVGSGGGDNMMGAIGSGNVAPGIVTVSLGTSGTLYAYSKKPVVDPQGDIAAFCDSTGGWLPLACTMNVTVATEMVRQGFALGDHESFEEAVQGVAPGCDGLLLLPYLEGERMPNVPKGTGVLLGLRPETADSGHLARAAMEGVTLGLRYGLERLKGLGLSADEIRLIGGGARSRAWRAMAADVFGLPVVSPLQDEGAAFGAALQALWTLQGGAIEEVVSRHLRLDPGSRREPDPERRRFYDDLYGLFSRLAEVLTDSDVFPRHRRFLEERTST